MSSDLVLAERDGCTVALTINRPDKLNALNDAVLDALEATFVSLERDGGVRAVILTGAGRKAFVAGADIGEIAAQTTPGAARMAARGQAIFRRIETFPGVVIAAVNGFALGGGCELAMACDIRIASETAMFGQPEVKLGIIPGYGGTRRLARLACLGMAMDMILTGRMVKAEEALRCGLVNQVVQPDELMRKARERAETASAVAPLAVRAAKQAILAGGDLPYESNMQLEAQLFATLFSSADMREGTDAFLSKREAKFTGE